MKKNNNDPMIDRDKRWLCIGFALLLILTNLLVPLGLPSYAQAATKQYAIIIADKYGKYTFADLNNSTDGSSTIEVTSSGNVMVPLKKAVKLMPVLTYRYDSIKKTATVVNTSNGKKIIYTKNSDYLNYYSSPKAKVVKIKMTYKMYVSPVSSSVMVHMNTLRWVMSSSKSFGYFKVPEMRTMGYDTQIYNGLIIYNPYKAVSEIPRATSVNGISAIVKVTVPEGYSVAQTFDLLVSKGVVSSTASLYDAMENYPFDPTRYPLYKELPDIPERCFKLEGYLYPDTYEFYRLSKPQDVIGKFLRNLESKITADDRAKAVTMGYSMDQIITIASIVEKETADPTMMPTIASVIYNRLNIGMKLQFDSSIYYVERYIKPYIDGDVNRFNSFYNTYKTAALPAGPISNPGKAAIQAALNPAVTDYLYFYSDDQGVYHFSAEYVNPESNVSSEQ